MARGPDLRTLRALLADVVGSLASYTHREIGPLGEQLGMPVPDEGSKRERVTQALADLTDADLPVVAERALRHMQVSPATRNAIQDVLWAGGSTLDIPTRTRRDIARDLDLAEFVPYSSRFKALLARLWVLDNGPLDWLLPSGATLGAQIDQHVFRNPGDWTAEDLFEHLDAFDAGNRRFILFLEGMASAEVLPDEPAQRRVFEAINPHLHGAGVELRQTGVEGGYPVFGLVSTQSARSRRPKNLIFATTAKPDIRFLDAADNDIEVLNPDAVLIYDRPITAEGIRWRDLQAWWKETQNLPTDEAAKKTLYARLGSCLPENSAAQRNLFALYHEIHGSNVPELPALLPEVWLHWDPKTVRARGREALLRFRMDFLLLLPRGQRVVLEVDGRQHYSTDGRPDSAKYAAGMKGDRDLKLSGYEVFRFGTDELDDPAQARPLLEQFFSDLFKRFDVALPPPEHPRPQT
ncbi:AbiJ-related protein [Nonomuraea endophytica]|uniref:AbiJ-related protein n=1 Tax=Nonomuraea endophytica TaxID=714136 RepID=UPI0037CA0F14